MAKVTLKKLRKEYGQFVAVKDIDLRIKDHEFIVLVGPSGCGKSTTLRMIAGLEDITSGEVYIGDQLANDVPPKDRDIAMVFQNYALYPHMSVYDNMAFALKLRKINKADIDKRVGEAARILELDQLLRRKPKELSGGQRQRVALGRAIVREPQVFLMDEPLSNLDAKLRVQMRTEISKLQQKLKTTTVYVTHDQTEAMTMGDRIVVMKDGIIQQVGTPIEVYEHPANIFVAGFIGSPAMNIIPCRLDEKEGQLYASQSDFSFPLTTKQTDIVKKAGTEKDVFLGIRPEDIVVATHTKGLLSLPADVVEVLGSETYLYLTLQGQTITARLAGHHVIKEGDNIPITFRQNKLHMFSKISGKTLF